MAAGKSELTPVARKVRKGLLAINGVVESPGIFGDDDAFWMDGKEIGYFQQGGEVFGLRLTKPEIRARRAELKNEPRVTLKASSDWLHMTLAKTSDVSLTLELAAAAVEAHRPAKGVPLALPPSGATLERMRRFH